MSAYVLHLKRMALVLISSFAELIEDWEEDRSTPQMEHFSI